MTTGSLIPSPVARPIQPTIVKQLAQLMAVLDPRCGFESHNRITTGEQCPACHLDLWTYIESLPKAWP